MLINSIALRLIVNPVALVEIAISMNKSPAAISFVVFPVSLVDAAIGPDLHTLPLSLIGQLVPLALIESASFNSGNGTSF
jgi:hypothetical protein